MTEGIIQDIFNKYRKQSYLLPKLESFNKLEKELIEAIRQHAKENIPDGSWIECPIEELIGDNI